MRFTSFAALRASNNPDLTLDGARTALAAAANAIAERDETINQLMRKEPYVPVEMVQETAAEPDRAAADHASVPTDPGGAGVEQAQKPPVAVA